MNAARQVVVYVILGFCAAVSGQTPPPDAPLPKPAAPARTGAPLIQRFGFGQLIEADDKHIVLRVSTNNTINGDTQDKRIDLLDGEMFELIVDNEPAKVGDLKLPMFASVERHRGFRDHPPKLFVMANSPSVSGTLTAISLPTLTITTGRERKAVTITTDENTRVTVALPDPRRPNTRAGKQGTLADLQPGMHLTVRPPTGVATFVSGTVPVGDAERAAAEALRPAKDDLFSGIVVKTDGNAVQISTTQHGMQTFETDGSTRITLDSRVVLLEELRPEMEVVVRRSANAAQAAARTLRVTATSEQVWGWIKSFDGNTLTLLQPHRLSPPSDLTVTLDDGVSVETFPDFPENTKPGNRSDLVVGRETKFVKRDGKLAVISVFTGASRPMPSATQPSTQP